MDECKAILERIALAVEASQQAQVFILARLKAISESLGGK